jgi:prevent-host-death family protein
VADDAPIEPTCALLDRMALMAYAPRKGRRCAVIKRMSAKEARDRFAELLGQVHYGKDTVIVEKQGKPMVAVIDVERYERLMSAWDEPFTVLDRTWAKNRHKEAARVQRDVAEAAAEIRTKARSKSRRRA